MDWVLYGACLLAGALAAYDLLYSRPLSWKFTVPEVKSRT